MNNMVVSFDRILFYYDGPQVFEALDEIGGHYIGIAMSSLGQGTDVAVIDEELQEQYFVAGVNPDSMRKFCIGAIDLRSLILDSQEDRRFSAVPSNLPAGELILEQYNEPLDDRILPDEGFYLHDSIEEKVEELVGKARNCNNLVVQLKVEPSESVLDHRMHLPKYVKLIDRFYDLIFKTVETLNVRAGLQKPSRGVPLLDIISPALPGSFQLMLAGTEPPDWHGKVALEDAFATIDKLMVASGSIEQTIDLLRAHRGHLASAYLELLRFLKSSNSGFRYSWALPSSTAIESHVILEKDLEPMITAMSGDEQLTKVELSIDGVFEKFNRNSGIWGLQTQDGSKSGKLFDDSVTLDGLAVGARYRFHCIEQFLRFVIERY